MGIKKVKQIFCSLLIVASFVATIEASLASSNLSFIDIDQSYAKEAINELVQQGILQGVDETSFNPKGYITRADFTTILVRTLQLPIDSSNTVATEFNDIQGSVAPYIISAYNAGIVTGVGTERFNPDGYLTREQAAKLLFLALNHFNPAITLDENVDPSFTDSDKISDWAKPYVATATKLGLISGKPNGSFDPKGIAKREMAAIMAKNLLNAMNKHNASLPAAPKNFATSNYTGTSITFTWDKPDNATNIVGYDLFMSKSRYEAVTKLGSTVGTSFTYTELDPNLSKATFYIRSRNSQGYLSDEAGMFYFSFPASTTLNVFPYYTTFTLNQEQLLDFSISGEIALKDVQKRVKLYVKIKNATKNDITVGSSSELGDAEFISEDSETSTLVFAWGGEQGIKLTDYLKFMTSVDMSFKLPITLHKKGIYSTEFELQTFDSNPVTLTSEQISLSSIPMIFEPVVKKEFDMVTSITQPPAMQVNQPTIIPITIQGKVREEDLTNLASLRIHFYRNNQNFSLNNLLIEDIDKFGHVDYKINTKDYISVSFDKLVQIKDLQHELANGLTFNLVVTVQEPGEYGLSAHLLQFGENGQLKDNSMKSDGSDKGVVIQLVVQ